jgi:hypothetical protein
MKGYGLAVAVKGDNPWGYDRNVGEKHNCFFCNPSLYPPMPDGDTLCSRCGQLIYKPGIDARNMGMVVCPKCDEDLMLDEMS